MRLSEQLDIPSITAKNQQALSPVSGSVCNAATRTHCSPFSNTSSQIDQHPFTQAKVADEDARHRQRLHHGSENNCAGDDHFLAASFEAGQPHPLRFGPGEKGLLDLLDSVIYAGPVAWLWWTLWPPVVRIAAAG